MVVCGDAGESLGDSLYEARLYVRGSVAGLGADCIEKEMRSEHVDQVVELLARAGVDDVDPASSAGTARRGGCTTSTSTTWARTDGRRAPGRTAGSRGCASRRRSTAT